jgi:pilus assembly protein FimV
MMPIIGGGLLVIIIAIIFFLKSKSNKQPPARPVAPPAAKPVAAPVAKAPEAVQPKPAPVEPKKPLDPLEEVQPYLEMERFPQAVGILTKALVQAPDRADLHLKLLEVFAKQKDRQSFDEQFAKLEMLGELEAIVEAEKLKISLPAPAKPAPLKGEALEFERVAAKPAEPVVPEASFSLDDLENDFKMSLSQPNLKALDIEIRPDPLEVEEVVETQKVAEIDALLDDSGLDFSFKKETKTEQPVALDQGLDFSFAAAALVEEEPVAKKSFDTGLSLDSLDDFLAEHKTEMAPALEEPKAETPAVDFEQALASFKEEIKEEPEFNLTEGFELEEFNVASEEPIAKIDSDFDALDVDFSIEDHAQVDAKSDFDLGDIKAPVVEGFDLSDAAAAFDQETLPEEALVDDLDLDFDVSVASDDVVADLDREFSFLATTDENATRLDLARAYMEMGDRMGARDLLEEVVAEGNSNQKNEAQGMLVRIG